MNFVTFGVPYAQARSQLGRLLPRIIETVDAGREMSSSDKAECTEHLVKNVRFTKTGEKQITLVASYDAVPGDGK